MARSKKSTDKVEYVRVTGDHEFVPSDGYSGECSCATCGADKLDSMHHRSVVKRNAPKLPPQKAIHQEAEDIVFGDREEAYDDPNINFRKIAKMWSGMLDKKLLTAITPRDVALMFILLKISRESFQPKRDNRVDIIGYTLCLQRIIEDEADDATK